MTRGGRNGGEALDGRSLSTRGSAAWLAVRSRHLFHVHPDVAITGPGKVFPRGDAVDEVFGRCAEPADQAENSVGLGIISLGEAADGRRGDADLAPDRPPS